MKMISQKCVCVHLFLFLFAVTVVNSAPPVDGADEDYDDSGEHVRHQSCDASNCKSPNCSCFGHIPNISMETLPQFVMLTFDDAVTVANIGTYRRITMSKRKHINDQGIRLTFFVCHEYNDYTLTNELYRKGHEIAVHSVSHESNTDLWRRASEDKWKKEMVGVRTMINAFSGIPASEIVGHRAPFLQTSGNTTFRMLKKEGFVYDSSMSSRSYMDPPIWPYTLDHGYGQDCQIEPCPNENFEGLWLVPMIQYRRRSKEGDFFCSMVDACTPQPTTAEDTKSFLMENFNRHYKSTKAPFPVFLHEAWLRDAERLKGYLEFIDEILTKKDVFVVSIRDVVEYMRNPVHSINYSPRVHPQPSTSCGKKEVCTYKQPLRNMQSCIPCPKYYPWVGSPLGRRAPKDFPNM